ncbi:hypothetical protein HDU98_010956 [Podochytrium sp. JEL0797]|nr:hypothetical protein HDU98_010956 [Podochytrium sp. JEL0797]
MNPIETNRNKDAVKQVFFIHGELLIRTVGINVARTSLEPNHKNTLQTAIGALRIVLNLDPFHAEAAELIKISYIYLTMFNSDVQENLTLLNQVTLFSPCDYQLQYNLGFLHQRVNHFEEALSHYKLSLGIIELELHQQPARTPDQQKGLTDFKIKNLNGLGGIYFSIQDRELATVYFKKALEIAPTDPDIHNQLGVVNTELRFTDEAVFHYMEAIKYASKASISTDKEMLLASIYMNMGLAKCYECDFTGAIECYNKALKYKPRLSLAYQNKLLDLNYISHLIEDPMYISKLHKNINKVYEKVVTTTPKGYKRKSKGQKLVLGFVSGDFICHPVSFFISSLLKNLDPLKFDLFCYSVKVTKLDELFPECTWRCVKNVNAPDFAKQIRDDAVDILFDLSAHTGDNRLDTFVLKPAPIQISYCGYPGTSGIKSMDYHITDKVADSVESEKYYSEKLVYMSKCFLCYTPTVPLSSLPPIRSDCPDFITFGSFNRFNKINKNLISVWERILVAIPTARLVMKTKEFLTPKILDFFKSCFTDPLAYARVDILPYSDTYLDHLNDYNKIDVALDSFPYSGTTTSCEALLMGCPVLTLFDSVRHYHAQNVTSSLMIHSDLKEYVTDSQDAYIAKAIELSKTVPGSKDLKMRIRNTFVHGPVCNAPQFAREFGDKLLEVYANHKF